MGAMEKMKRIAERDRGFVFTSLAHLINEESLKECYGELNKNSVSGVDEVTVEEYGEKLVRGLKEMNLWLKGIRNVLKLKEWWKILGAKLRGHYNCFGISGNYRCLRQHYGKVLRLTKKWINRRSQKKSMGREKFRQYLDWNPLPQPRIYHDLYTL